jgi:hypothetical protein
MPRIHRREIDSSTFITPRTLHRGAQFDARLLRTTEAGRHSFGLRAAYAGSKKYHRVSGALKDRTRSTDDDDGCRYSDRVLQSTGDIG